MTASLFDSPLHSHLFPTGDLGRLFSDSAALRAMLLVEGALAKVQGQAGLIPEISAAAIHRATLEIQIDPGAIAAATGRNGVCIPGLVAEFRKEMNMPEHAQYLHWGATSQDIIDSALMLRLRQALLLIEADLKSLIRLMADQAAEHAATPMAGRTYAMHATPTSWGAVLAQWGEPLIDALEKLDDLRAQNLWVSLSGAAGTAQALGADASALRAALAGALGLQDPMRSWHTDRTPVLRIADWLGTIPATLAAMASTLIALGSSDTAEIETTGAGASSTMPQKQNPVGASAVVALGHQTAALRTGLHAAGQHMHQRDAGAWFTEWMVLPQIVLGAGAALKQMLQVLKVTAPRPDRMRAALSANGGTIFAEALSFALCAQMSRPQAQSETKRLCAEALASGTPLEKLARQAHPDLPDTLFDGDALLGSAPQMARRFADRARAIP